MDPAVEAWHGVLGRIIDESHLAGGDELVAIAAAALAPMGISVELYLVDLAQRTLHAVPPSTAPSLDVDSTAAGRAFRLTEFVTVDEPPHLWVPVLDGTERLGVLRMSVPTYAQLRDAWLREQYWQVAGLLGHLVMTKLRYSDVFHVARRPRPLSVAAELVWQLLPPQTFARDRLVVTAVLEPYDQVGGDGFDYAADDGRATVAVFDAMGHDLAAGLTVAVALAATRSARRRGLGLVAAAALADEAITRQAELAAHHAFATALLAELDLETGELTFLTAGHPLPVLLRDGRMVKELRGPVRLPLGMGHLDPQPPAVGREMLKPGDRVLLYTDGVTEARSPTGDLFGLEQLVDLTERHHTGGMSAPEALRRIARTVLDHQHGELQDDATLLLVEWAADRPKGLSP
ncbi:MAG TPA: PP2C family protein-serine/threonine phosphatase [Pseudonocardiaceae bacterium]|jgi:hypothetical protein|nr:PP2C family protein-serine/threonine phosphatase [Pseudonocardiaceae bacterium]